MLCIISQIYENYATLNCASKYTSFFQGCEGGRGGGGGGGGGGVGIKGDMLYSLLAQYIILSVLWKIWSLSLRKTSGDKVTLESLVEHCFKK